MKQKICGALAVLALVWMLGVAGGSDLGLNSVKELIIQSGAALTLFAGSLYVGGFLGGRPAKGGHDENRH